MELELDYLGAVLLAKTNGEKFSLGIPTSAFTTTKTRTLKKALDKDIVTLKSVYADCKNDWSQDEFVELYEGAGMPGTIPYLKGQILCAYHTREAIGEAGDGNLQKAVEHLQAAEAAKNTEDTATKFSQMAETNLDGIFEVEKNNNTWGIAVMDKRFGKPVDGLFHVVAGESGVGKSFFMLDIAIENSKHSNVAFFSLEMEKEDFLKQYIRAKVGLTDDDVAEKNYTAEQVAEANRIREGIEQSNIVFIDKPDFAKQDVIISVDSLMKLADDNGVDMIFIDSLSMIRDDSEKSHVAEAALTKQLSEWCDLNKDKGTPRSIFLIHHLDKKGDTFAGSAKIEHNCDLMLYMRWEDKDDGVIKISTGKVRKHKHGKLNVRQNNGSLVAVGYENATGFGN